MIKLTTSAWHPSELFKLLGVALAYSVMGWLVQFNFAPKGEATLLFLPSGIALAALLIGGKRYALAIWVGALISNQFFNPVLWASTGMAIGSTGGALVSAWLIKQRGNFDASLSSVRNLIQIGLGGMVGALISALIGAAILVLTGVASNDTFLITALEWGMGDLLGVVLITPLILVWWPTAANPIVRPSPKLLAEAALILTATALAGTVIFQHTGIDAGPAWLHTWLDSTAQGYWMFLYIAWAAMRLGTRGTSLALLASAMLGFSAVYSGNGHFAVETSAYKESNYWFFCILLSLVGMTLAIYISASKKTTRSLRKSEAALNQELSNVLAAVDQHSIVATTDVQGRITFVNDKLCKISGYTREELLGQNHRMLNSGLHPKSFFQNLYQTLQAGNVWHGEVRNRAKDGHFYWVQTTITPFMGDDGLPVKYVIIRTDITQRKLAEVELQLHRDHLRELVQQKTADLQLTIEEKHHALAELRLAEKAALAASQAKSEFLANMSHEIRTPMNGVIGMLEVLEHTELNAQQNRMVATIHRSSMMLLTILNDILDLSKIEAGKLSIESLPTHLGDLTDGVAQLMVTSSSSTSPLQVTVSPELPLWITTDPTRLRQVLMNLLGNAFKFTPNTPEHPAQVTLTVTPCELAQGGPGMRLRVTDNGIGISPQAQTQLFQSFTQADASTARKFGGTGLGLSISQRLVTLMGGQISVQSTLGEGAAFTIELPLQAADSSRTVSPDSGLPVERRRPPPRAPAPSIEEAQRTGRLILLAEDNETNRDVIQEQLSLLGYASETADDGVAALTLWRTGRFSLLLTDCHMPQMDGFELTTAIRQTKPQGTHFPIVAITANARQGEAERCRAHGMDDYLAKPLRLKELGPMLTKWMPTAINTSAAPANAPVAMTEAAAETVAKTGSLAIWDATTLPGLVGDNPAMQRRLLDKFLVNAQVQLAAIGEAALARDSAALAGVAHTLKSAARSVGALHLGELCQTLETAGLAGDATSCSAVATELPQALADVQACITAHLANPARG